MSKLCLLCHIEHVRISPGLERTFREAGISEEEIQAVKDQIELETEVHPIPSMRSRVPAVLGNIGATGMFSEEELGEFQAILEGVYPEEQDDPGSSGYVPEAFKEGVGDAAVAQARREAQARARKERFEAKHPDKHAEYQRKYRKKKKKAE